MPKIQIFRFSILLLTLVLSLVDIIKLSLPWYVTFFYVWGTTGFVADLMTAIQKTWEEPK